MAAKPVNHESQPLLSRPMTIRSPSRIYLTVALFLAGATAVTAAAAYKEPDHVPQWAPIVPAGGTFLWILKGFWDARTVYQIKQEADLERGRSVNDAHANGAVQLASAVNLVATGVDEGTVQTRIKAAVKELDERRAALERELDEIKALLPAQPATGPAAPVKDQVSAVLQQNVALKSAETRRAALERELAATNGLLVAARVQSGKLPTLESENTKLRKQIEELSATLAQAQAAAGLTEDELGLFHELNGIFDEYLVSFPEDPSAPPPVQPEEGKTSTETELLKILGKADTVKAKLEAFIQSRITFINALRDAGGAELQQADDRSVLEAMNNHPTALQSPQVKATLAKMVAKSPSRSGTPVSSPASAKGTPRRKAVPSTPTHSTPAASSPAVAPLTTPPPVTPKQKSPARNLNQAFAAAAETASPQAQS